ncbi:MAG: LytR C-terminal domain-containing protein [Patescibacteria group bacterium]
MTTKDEKPRKKVVVEEISSETPKIEVPVETQPHVEPGIHEQIKKEETVIPITPPAKSGPNALVIIIPGIFLLGALLGGIYFYQSSVNKNPIESKAPVAMVSQNPIPTATPKVEGLDLTKFPISILNGSGIKGEASKAQAIIEKDGFKVSATGNASNYSYKETMIQIKSGVSDDFIVKLKETLGESYKVATKTQSLKDSFKDDVVVILGSSKSE